MEREELLRNLKQVREKEKDRKYSVGQLNVFDMVSDVINYLEHEEKPTMTNLEWLKENFKECLSDGYTPPCRCIYMAENGCDCNNVLCKNCEYNTLYKILDYLPQEHKEPIKLKQWEYDLIKIDFPVYRNDNFASSVICMRLKEKGYFKGIKDILTKVEYILDNCIIISDDYEGFEDYK